MRPLLAAIRAAKLVSLLGPVQAATFLMARVIRADRIGLRVRGVPHPVLLRPTASDIFCLWQVFGRRDCGAPIPQAKAILDAGANVGFASLFYALAYPGTRIVAVEPDASNFELAATNLRGYPNVTLVHGALWSRAVPVTIENPDDAPWAFRVGERQGSASVPGLTVYDLGRRVGIDRFDLVKIDVEGAEQQIFRDGPLEWIDDCTALVVEIHNESAGRAVDAAFAARPFSKSRQGEKLVFVRHGTTLGVPASKRAFAGST